MRTSNIAAGINITTGIAPFLLCLTIFAQPAAAQIERFGADDNNGIPTAVVVSSKHLVFTSQIFPIDRQGKIVGENDSAAQTQKVLSHLTACFDGKLETTAKISVYITDSSVVPQVRTEIAKAFSQGQAPAVSFVVTSLRVPNALIAMDAVMVVGPDHIPSNVRRTMRTRTLVDKVGVFGMLPDTPADTVLIPSDRLILVSGQAEPGELRESVRKTCESLIKTVKLAGGDADSIAQVKIFMNSLNDIPAVLEVMYATELRSTLPAVSFVQWTNNNAPEIEIIAAQTNETADDKSDEPIRFLTPPWMTESPVYSKVAVTNSERLIFTSGLYGSPNTDGETQVKSLFADLEKVMKEAGSDLRHLGKATYYVADDDVSKQLNALRPNYYDPKRPPAASKASVTGVGNKGCSITLDMIAVPAK